MDHPSELSSPIVAFSSSIPEVESLEQEYDEGREEEEEYVEPDFDEGMKEEWEYTEPDYKEGLEEE